MPDGTAARCSLRETMRTDSISKRALAPLGAPGAGARLEAQPRAAIPGRRQREAPLEARRGRRGHGSAAHDLLRAKPVDEADGDRRGPAAASLRHQGGGEQDRTGGYGDETADRTHAPPRRFEGMARDYGGAPTESSVIMGVPDQRRLPCRPNGP